MTPQTFAYVTLGPAANGSDITKTRIYSVDPSTHHLNEIDETNPTSIPKGYIPGFNVIDPLGHFVLFNDFIFPNYDISGFHMLQISARYGDLTESAHLADTSAMSYGNPTFSSDGKTLFATRSDSDSTSSVLSYSINRTTGVLAPISTISDAALGFGIFRGRLALHPSGKFAFVSSSGNGDTLTTIKIATAGGLSVGTSIAEGAVSDGDTPFVVDPSGSLVFQVGSNGPSTNFSLGFRAYSINATTGALTFLRNSTFPLIVAPPATPDSVIPVAKVPGVLYLIQTVGTQSSITTYTYDKTTGVLTQRSNTPYTGLVTSIDFNASFTTAYLTLNSADGTQASINEYSVNSVTGALTASAPPIVIPNASLGQIAVMPVVAN
jgi:6-phosphogluconolactonase (cycloisomerase 2 family)